MQAPRFWFNPPKKFNFLKIFLSPLGWLYGKLTALRIKKQTKEKLGVPVICIGNLNAGGTGKTPTTIAIAQYLISIGINAHIVSRGYGGEKVETPIQIDQRNHSAEQTGDEPLLMAAFAPTWVSNNRRNGAKAAIENGAEIILLDDGFQDPKITKDFSIIVVDAQKGFGNGACIPAGPLRETISSGLKRADLILSVGSKTAQNNFLERYKRFIPKNCSHIRAVLKPLETGMDWRGTRVLAFAGIGHPEKFFATLKKQGATLIKAEALSDHQILTPAIMNRLISEADAHDAQLVTTEKDQVRLPKEYKFKVVAMPVRLNLYPDYDWGKILKPILNLASK